MNSFVTEVCSRTRDLINMIDATMVEVVLYARKETMMYANDQEFQQRMVIQAEGLSGLIGELDGVLRNHQSFFESITPPENVPGQVLAIADVIVARVSQLDPQDCDSVHEFFRSLPLASRHELMDRLRAYRDFVRNAAGLEPAEPGDPGFSTEPIMPYWW